MADETVSGGDHKITYVYPDFFRYKQMEAADAADAITAQEAYDEYIASGRKRTPVEAFWAELDRGIEDADPGGAASPRPSVCSKGQGRMKGRMKGRKAMEMEYRGFRAVAAHDPQDCVYVGTVSGVSDVLTFHADAQDDLDEHFHGCVDDYLEICRKYGRRPDFPMGTAFLPYPRQETEIMNRE